MNKTFLILTVMVCLLAGVLSCTRHGMVESEFSLATESRLPNWFNFPDGSSVSDYSVNLTYYSSKKVKVVVLERKTSGKKAVLFESVGESKWHPISEKKFKEQGGHTYYPQCDIVTINGKEEVLLQKKREPILYVIDDTSLCTKE